MTYYVIDHRAPRYIPRGEAIEVALVFLTLGLLAAAATLIGAAVATASLTVAAFAAPTVAVTLKWIADLRRYVIRIPNGYAADRSLEAMQIAYKANPALREVIEPVLVASYDLARSYRFAAISERAAAVAELVKDYERTPGVNTGTDLQELRRLIEARREMRREGLL